MIVPMTAIAMDHLGPGSQASLGFLLPLLVIGDFIAVWQYRRLFSLNIVKHLLPGTLAGLILGGLMLHWFHNQKDLVAALIKIEIGCESILLVSLAWWRQWRGVQKSLLPEPWRSHATGAFAAASSTLAHAAGPIVVMYLLPLNLNRQLFVGTSAIYFFIVNSAKLPVYYKAGVFEHAHWWLTFKTLPLVFAGAIFGLWVNKRINDKLFTKVVYIITFLLGWYMLYDGLHGLLGGHT